MEIKDGKEELDKELNRVPHTLWISFGNCISFVITPKGSEIRHRDMKREVEKVLEEFNKRRNRLHNAHVSITQRVDQSSRLREGVCLRISVKF